LKKLINLEFLNSKDYSPLPIYVVIKIAKDAATREKYVGIIEQRELWREEIRSLEE
jgi:hypothetical protein